MDVPDLIAELNPQQREAVLYTDGPLLILAGAGSGKTRVLTYKIAYLIQQGIVKPWQILAVTFTNKAANEMKERVERLLNTSVQGLWIGTFHAICARILRREAHHLGIARDFTIYDTDDQLQVINRIVDYLNVNKELIKPRAIQYAISAAKNSMITPRVYQQSARGFREETIAKVYWEYQVALERNNALDFDDLLLKPLDLFTQFPEVLEKYQQLFQYILVDEYQDTNKAQYHFIRLLSAAHQHVCVVGDEDQSIYRWRGADISNILNFEKDFANCKVIRLEQNYRSTQIILDAANQVVANNVNRLGKNLWSDKGQGEKIAVVKSGSEVEEALQVVQIIRQEVLQKNQSYRDIAILYRTNAQSRALEDQLRRANIPYQIVGGQRFYERKEIKDVLAYLRILVNPDDTISLLRIINVPARQIGSVTIRHVENFAREHGISVYQALHRVQEITALTPTARRQILHFIQQVETIRQTLAVQDAFTIAREVVERFGLLRMYEKSDLPEEQSRMENIVELLNSIQIFVQNRPEENNTLTDYLEEVSLVTDIDRWDPENPAVTLMTLHAAKGLEFPVVIITGLEDGLFPLSRSLTSEEELEEERRLFYVGMTRAKERLYLSWAIHRHRFQKGDFGNVFHNTPSRFLNEIPEEYKEEQPRQKERRKQRYATPSFLEEKALPDTDSPYKIGHRVRHETFGEGQILGVEKGSTGTKLTVVFADKKVRKLIAEYANLELLN